MSLVHVHCATCILHITILKQEHYRVPTLGAVDAIMELVIVLKLQLSVCPSVRESGRSPEASRPWRKKLCFSAKLKSDTTLVAH